MTISPILTQLSNQGCLTISTATSIDATDSQVCGVLLAVGRYPPAHGGGGLRAHRTYKRLRKFLRLGVYVVTESDGNLPSCKSTYDGIDVFRILNNSSYLRSALVIGHFFLTHSLRRINLVHAMGMSYVAMAAAAWSQFFGIPLVRELTVDGDIPSGGGLLHRVCRRGFTHADLVIASSANIEKRYLAAGVQQDRIWRRPNPVDTGIFRAPTAGEHGSARQRYGFIEGNIVHLVLARFHPRKNQLLAVQALSRLPGNHFLLLSGPVLPGDESYYQAVTDTVIGYGLGDRVRFEPAYNDNPVCTYHAADCCWIPSVLEGLPNTMLEALCTGLPVMVNSMLCLEDYLCESYGCYQAEPDPAKFAASACRVIKQDLSLEMRNQRARSAASHYEAASIDNEFIRRISKLY